MSRPAWCPDQHCEFRGGLVPLLCGGRTASGARLCLDFQAPVGVRTLDRITDGELADFQGLLGAMKKEASDT